MARFRDALHRQLGLWLMVWSLFALIGCPFWCDSTQDSPFVAPPQLLCARSKSAVGLSLSQGGRITVLRQAPLPQERSIGNSFDFDEFCQLATADAAPPSLPSCFLFPFVMVVVNPRPVVLQSALHGRAGPPQSQAHYLLVLAQSLLGRAPPRSV